MRLFTLLVLLIALLLPKTTFAQMESSSSAINYQEKFYKAEVIQIIEEGEKQVWETTLPFQKVKLKILDGDKQNEEITIEHGSTFQLKKEQMVNQNETVIIMGRTTLGNVMEYHIIDKYRMNNILVALAAFGFLVLWINKLKGLGALVGLGLSLLIIIKFIIPNILAGHDPVIISIIGAAFIMLISVYLAHGFSKKTTVSLVSIFLALVLTGILSAFFVSIAKLTGLGSEEAYGLRFGTTGNINTQGLLLGGMIIGALGVLDDVVMTQTTAVFELHKLNPALKFYELFQKALIIGREHISSVVNTLALAYTGVSLPILIFLVNNPTSQPIWFLINSEAITEEIIRTLAGSFGLVLAVPLATFLASWIATRKK